MTAHTTARTTRRTLLQTGAATSLAAPLVVGGPAGPATAAATVDRDVLRLEEQYGVTIGLAARDLRSGRRLVHRGGTRFPMLSTFKVLAAAAVLRDHDRRGETLQERVFFPPADVLDYAPVAEERVRTGMTVAEQCRAAIQLSDNTAGNLLLRRIGGPRAITAFARSLGDDVTRLDRWEPDLNTALPGDRRDTTTPTALAGLLRRLLVGDALAERDRDRLTTWMLGNQTSEARFRDGLPRRWTLADKTGSGDYGTAHDAGVAFRPDGSPVVVVALTRQDQADAVTPDQVLADLARLVVRRFR